MNNYASFTVRFPVKVLHKQRALQLAGGLRLAFGAALAFAAHGERQFTLAAVEQSAVKQGFEGRSEGFTS